MTHYIRPEPRPLPDPRPPVDAWPYLWAVIFAALGIALMLGNGRPTDPPLLYLTGCFSVLVAAGFVLAAHRHRIH